MEAKTKRGFAIFIASGLALAVLLGLVVFKFSDSGMPLPKKETEFAGQPVAAADEETTYPATTSRGGDRGDKTDSGTTRTSAAAGEKDTDNQWPAGRRNDSRNSRSRLPGEGPARATDDDRSGPGIDPLAPRGANLAGDRDATPETGVHRAKNATVTTEPTKVRQAPQAPHAPQAPRIPVVPQAPRIPQDRAEIASRPSSEEPHRETRDPQPANPPAPTPAPIPERAGGDEHNQRPPATKEPGPSNGVPYPPEELAPVPSPVHNDRNDAPGSQTASESDSAAAPAGIAADVPAGPAQEHRGEDPFAKAERFGADRDN